MSSTVKNKVTPKKKTKKLVTAGVVHIQASFNNTIVSITDLLGNLLSAATSGGSGFRGSRKSTPYAAQVAAAKAVQVAKEYGLQEVSIRVKGPGPGRESAIRKVCESFKKVASIVDVTGVPFNGCRGEKERRV
ncbi:MAG: 30S ribosomal protein S11 [Gammaproteobacteria bacterium]